jgi:CheY-like chemotaxis protein
MGATDSREIAIVMFHYSVVIKGIERRLTEMEYNVTIVKEDFEQEVLRLGGRVSLMIFYLPPEINGDITIIKVLQNMCDVINDRQQKAIFIGESKYRSDLLKQVSAIGTRTWLDRPVDMDDLELTVTKVIEAPVSSSRKKRILIVDDDPSYAKIVREWIRDEYKVDIVTAGMQAITFLLKVPEDDKIDMILLDYEMPVVDGPQVLQMLRQEEATAKIPVIFLTGNGTREAVSRVMALKPDGYILKSTQKEALLEFLKGKLQ